MNTSITKFLFIVSLAFFFSFFYVSALEIGETNVKGVVIQMPVVSFNYSSVNVNNSQFLQGLTPQQVANLFVEADPIFMGQNTSMWAKINNKFNATYNLWAYNQTTAGNSIFLNLSGGNANQN